MVRKEIDPAKGVNDLRRFHEACERGLLDVVEQSLGAFNIFSVLSVGNYEIRHSNMLAWLFTPGASHGCGAAFLDNVLRRIVERNPEKKEYARFFANLNFECCDVGREVEDRDIQIVFRKSKLVVVIENKWDASEREDGDDGGQLNKYRKQIQKEYQGWHHVFIFLTLDGRRPSQKNLQAWGVLGYSEILSALNEMDLSRVAEDVKMFVNHYRAIIDRKVGNMNAETKELIDRICREHEVALDYILENRNYRWKEILEWSRRGIQLKDGTKLEPGDYTQAVNAIPRWIQFRPRVFNGTRVHYEVGQRNNKDIFVALHIEGGGRENKRVLESKGIEKVEVLVSEIYRYSVENLQRKILEELTKLYQRFEPLIVRYANNVK